MCDAYTNTGVFLRGLKLCGESKTKQVLLRSAFPAYSVNRTKIPLNVVAGTILKCHLLPARLTPFKVITLIKITFPKL